MLIKRIYRTPDSAEGVLSIDQIEPVGEGDQTISDVDKEFGLMPDDEPLVPEPAVKPVEPAEPAAPVTPPVEDTPAAPEVKDPVKPQEPAPVESKPAEVVTDPLARLQPQTQDQPSVVYPEGSRERTLVDLGITAPDKIAAFKQMSNPAFNEVVEMAKSQQSAAQHQAELQQQLEDAKKGGIPESYQDHPQGYTLSPDYQKLGNDVQELNYELAHYEKALAACKKGEEWHELGRNADNSYALAAKREASVESEAYLLRCITSLDSARRNAYTQANSIKQQFESARETRTNTFAHVEDTLFPQYKGKESTNQYIAAMNKLMQERGIASNPMSGIASKLYAHALETQDKLNAAEAKLKQLSTTNAAAPQTPNPTADEINSGGTTTVNSTETMDSVSKEFGALLDDTESEYA